MAITFNVCHFLFLVNPSTAKTSKNVQQMQSALKKGDKVVTIGGMHGLVDAIDESQVVVRSTDGSKLTFDRNAIREVRSVD